MLLRLEPLIFGPAVDLRDSEPPAAIGIHRD
jgi:hypothetical protein